MTNQFKRELIVLVSMIGLSGCASDSGARPQPATATEHASLARPDAGHGPLCPLQVPGATVTESDVGGGAALDFRTSAEHVAGVRQRVRLIAAVYNHHGAGTPIDGSPEPSVHSENAEDVHPDLGMPVASASVEDIDDGARLVLRPESPSQLQALRERARAHAAGVRGDDCERVSASRS
jgi:hypothetical protein